jgi:hypothetical protein
VLEGGEMIADFLSLKCEYFQRFVGKLLNLSIFSSKASTNWHYLTQQSRYSEEDRGTSANASDCCSQE